MNNGTELVNDEWVTAMMIRWSLAVAYLEALEIGSLPEEQSIYVLVKQDIPLLVTELSRLRLELARFSFY